MKYTILVDEGSNISARDILLDIGLSEEFAEKFIIPIYSYIIFKGTIDLSYDENGVIDINNEILKKEVKQLTMKNTLKEATMEEIKKSLEFLLRENKNEEVVIYSDNKRVIDNINDKGKYYREIKSLINGFKKIRFIWIERTFNKWADDLIHTIKGRMNTDMPLQLFKEAIEKLKIKIIKLESNNKKLETNNDIYKSIIEKQNKEIQEYNSSKNENEKNKYIVKQQKQKINTLREINRELQDDLQYNKRKVEELKKENDDLVKKMHEKYTEEFCEEFEMVGSSKEL